jgi:hypothetical protein
MMKWPMQLSPRLRLQAIFCAFVMLVCEFISYPFTTMGVCDDGPYIRMAQTFAETGHIVYNGWAAAMLVSQLYLAGIFIKLFGFSFTTVRMSNLLLAAITAYVFQRMLVRAGCSEGNATLGTLAVVLSPLYLMLSATFMSDISGLLAVILCLYGCIRALQSNTDRAVIAWLCLAVVANAIFGTSRQIAWLGDLVMVPSVLWLLRSRGRVFLACAAAVNILGVLFIFGCVHWLSRQPFIVPVPLLVSPFPKRIALRELSYILLEVPFLILPIIGAFLPEIRKGRKHVMILLSAAVAIYVAIAIRLRHLPNPAIRLEPTAGAAGGMVNIYGVWGNVPGLPPFLRTWALVLFTVVSIGGLAGVIAVALKDCKPLAHPTVPSREGLTWRQITILCLPFSLAYLGLLVAAAGTTHAIYDRYAMGLLGPVLIVLIRCYQQKVQPNLPLASGLLIIIMAAYGIVVTHNTFAFNRARVALGDELHAAGVPYTAIDGGWEYNFDTELRNADHINLPLIKNPPNAYVTVPSPPPDYCQAFWYERTPHVHAVYGMAIDTDSCFGPAPFAPVQYRPWPLRKPLNIYAVLYVPPGKS